MYCIYQCVICVVEYNIRVGLNGICIGEYNICVGQYNMCYCLHFVLLFMTMIQEKGTVQSRVTSISALKCFLVYFI